MTLHKTYPILSCLQLIAYCLENINIKKITTEFWNDIVVVIVTPLTLGLYEDLYCEKAGKCVSSLLGVFFVYDMMIDGFSEQLAESISVAAAKKCKGLVHIKALNDYLNTEYVKYRNQNIKAFIEELQTLLTHKGLDNLIVLRS